MSNRLLSRRQVLAGSLAVSAAALTACAVTPAPQVVTEATPAQGEPAAAAAQPVNLDFWYIWGGDGGKAMEQVSAVFAERNPHITMHPLTIGGAILDKTIAAYAAGAPPDIVDLILCAPLAARGALVTIDDFIATSTVFDEENYFSGQWDGTRWAGRRWGIPANEGLGWLGLFRNDQLVEGAGLDAGAPPRSYDDLFSWSEAISQRDGTKLTTVGYTPPGMLGYPDCASVVSGQHYFDGDTLKYHLTSEPILEIYRQEKRFYDAYGAENLADFGNSFSGQPIADPVNAGKTGLWTTGSWGPGGLEQNAVEGMTWSVDYMVDSSGAGEKPFFAGTHVMMLLKGGRAPQEAWKFLEFSSTDEYIKMVYDACGFIMGTKSFIETLDLGGMYPGLDFFVKGLSEGTRVWGLAPDPNWYTVLFGMYDAFEAVGFGKQTPEEALGDLEKLVTDELNKLIGR